MGLVMCVNKNVFLLYVHIGILYFFVNVSTPVYEGKKACGLSSQVSWRSGADM